MKILQLCKKFPFPLKDGESIAVTSLSKALCEEGCELTLLAMNTAKHYFQGKEVPEALRHYSRVISVDVDNRIKFKDAFLNLFSRESYHISRFISQEYGHQLAQLLKREDFDVIQLETMYLAPYIPIIRRYTDAPVAMRAHNIEHEIWERITLHERSFFRRKYLEHLTNKLKRYEVKQFRHYDLMVPISPRDQEGFRQLGFAGRSVVAPIGLDMNNYQPDFSSYQRDLSLSFIGSLDWIPNQEGLRWFLLKIWPRIHRQFPALRLHVAGRNMPEWLAKIKLPNLVVEGEVEHARTFIARHSIMVVPLLSGSGMRAKILEAMALGKVVLTTSIGLEGIEAKPGREVLIADQVADFIDCLRGVYQAGTQLERIGRQARLFVETNYDARMVARQLLKTYSALTVEAI